MKALIVGASGVVGRAAITALRELDPDAEIMVTSSRSEPVADLPTITGIDLNGSDYAERIAAARFQPELLFFTPAFGAVGSPVALATGAEIKATMAFCVDPMVKLTNLLQPRLTVGYTAFYFKPHLLAFYGSLAYVKYAMEKLAVTEPSRYKMLRSGSFPSKASRGIGILLQRQMKSPPEHMAALVAEYRASGKKFPDFFFDFINEQEQTHIAQGRPYRQTTEGDLVDGHRLILAGEPAPIVNVLGELRWMESTLPQLPVEMQRAAELLAGLV